MPISAGDSGHVAEHNRLAALSSIKDRRWVRGSTANANDDEFNDSSLAGAWTRVDASGGTSRATWTEDADVLSLLLSGGDSAGELHGMVKSYALAVGESIETHVSALGPNSNYPLAGPIVADGSTHGSGLQEFFAFFVSGGVSTFDLSPSEWSSWNSRTAFTDNSYPGFGNDLFMRIKRSATNTYQHFASPDGVSWFQLGADRTQTMTPAYVGFAGSTYGGSSPMVFSFDYFRVV